MSKLVEFLTWWLAEAESGKPSSKVMEYGLCFLWDNYPEGGDFSLFYAFEAYNLDTCYPFGDDDFWLMKEVKQMHLDPNRLDWVRKYLADHV